MKEQKIDLWDQDLRERERERDEEILDREFHIVVTIFKENFARLTSRPHTGTTFPPISSSTKNKRECSTFFPL